MERLYIILARAETVIRDWEKVAGCPLVAIVVGRADVGKK